MRASWRAVACVLSQLQLQDPDGALIRLWQEVRLLALLVIRVRRVLLE